MKMSPDKFKALQRQWYKILEDSGFEDIEKVVGDELVLKQNASHGFLITERNLLQQQAMTEYFRLMSQKVNDEYTVFNCKEDAIILEMHCLGARVIDIINTLKSNGMYRNRNTIRYIIRRYEVNWNIKNYERKKLNNYYVKKELNRKGS